jgi:hypothetical protein
MKRSICLVALVGTLSQVAAPLLAHMPGERIPERAVRTESADPAIPGFVRRYIDLEYGGNGKPGWVRAGDMDLDGDLDLVAGGGEALFIYENNGRADGWRRFGNLDASDTIGANGGELFDVDKDNDLDVVSAKYESDLGWWENPGGALSEGTWPFHTLSTEDRYLHDLIRVDIDGDEVAQEFIANLNEGYSGADITLKWFRPGPDPEQPWEWHTIEPDRAEGSPHGHAGLDLADIDGDDDFDLAYSNGWYEGPADPTGVWVWHQITTQYGISNTLARDMDGDDDLDLIMGAGHHGEGVYWFEQPADPVSGTWIQHDIDATLWHPECLQTVDLQGDGDVDLVTCDLFFGEDPGEPDWSDEAHNIYLFENLPGADAWARTTLSPHSYPSHQLQVTDVNGDGHWDVLSESAGYSVISYYENASSTVGYRLEVIDDAYPGNGRPGWSSTGDLNGDGLMDVIAGGGGAIHWYRAPDWTRFPLEPSSTAGGNGGLILDVDRNGTLDVVAALYLGELVWWQNPGPSGVEGTWTRHPIDTSISTFNHDLALGNLDQDSDLEIVALYVGGGVHWYDIPADPTSDSWSRTTILPMITDPHVGLAVCDLDGDTDNDVVASNWWYERPADPSTPDWTARQLFVDAVQNVACLDVDGNGHLDVVGAEGFVNPDGGILWAESPPDPRNDLWSQHLVVEGLDGPENIWAGDLDGDGLADIVSGEMGTSSGFDDSDSNFFVMYGRDATGTLWERRDLGWAVGVSARLQPTDIEGDGGIDFVADGNAEDHIYLWRQVGFSGLFADGFESGDTATWSQSIP